MNEKDPDLIGFYILSGVSIAVVFIILLHLHFTHDLRELKSRFLFGLFASVLFGEIAYLPEAYTENNGLCQFMAWLHYYSGLINVLILFFMSCHYFSYINNELYSTKINRLLKKYAIFVALGFPLITLLPLSTHSYQESRGLWCTLPPSDDEADKWAWGVVYSWIILFLNITAIQFFYSLYRLSVLELENRMSLFLSAGVYIIISFIAWIPRILQRVFQFEVKDSANNSNLITTSFLYLSGLLYAVAYVYNTRKEVELQESGGGPSGFRPSVSLLPVNADSLQNILLEGLVGDSYKTTSSASYAFSIKSRTKSTASKEKDDPTNWVDGI